MRYTNRRILYFTLQCTAHLCLNVEAHVHVPVYVTRQWACIAYVAFSTLFESFDILKHQVIAE